MENSLAIFHKIKQVFVTLPSNFTLRYSLRRNMSADIYKDEHRCSQKKKAKK